MAEYVGMAKGNPAWVYLRDGNLASAFEQSTDGVQNLRETNAHILLWAALWPLIGVKIVQGQIGDAIDHVETLLTPPQMAICADLDSAMQGAVDAWKGNDRAAAKIHLEKASELACEMGYL